MRAIEAVTTPGETAALCQSVGELAKAHQRVPPTGLAHNGIQQQAQQTEQIQGQGHDSSLRYHP